MKKRVTEFGELVVSSEYPQRFTFNSREGTIEFGEVPKYEVLNQLAEKDWYLFDSKDEIYMHRYYKEVDAIPCSKCAFSVTGLSDDYTVPCARDGRRHRISSTCSHAEPIVDSPSSTESGTTTRKNETLVTCGECPISESLNARALIGYSKCPRDGYIHPNSYNCGITCEEG